MPDERVLQALLRFSFDRRTAAEVKRGVTTIEDALMSLDEQAAQAQESMSRLTEGTQILAIAGEQLSMIGQAISRPLMEAAGVYVQYAGRAEATSRRWLTATEDLERAQFRVGRAVARAALPAMEMAADLAEKASRFVEQHPDIVGAVMQIGTVTAALGAVGMAVTRGIRLYADVKLALVGSQQLAAATLMSKAAKTQLAAATVMVTGRAVGAVGAAAGGAAAAGGGMLFMPGAVGAGAAGVTAGGAALAGLGGLILGGGVNEALAQLDVLDGRFATTAEIMAVVAHQAGKLVGAEMEWGAAVAHLTGQIDDATYASYQAAQAAEDMGESIDELHLGEALDAFIQFQMQEMEVEYQYNQERLDTDRQFERERMMMEEQYARQRMEMTRDFERQKVEMVKAFDHQSMLAVRDFNRGEARVEEDHRYGLVQMAKDFARQEAEVEVQYYQERARAAADFGLETQRMEEDHQRQMRMMREDHDARMGEAIRSRDALAMLGEMRSYERDRSRAEEEYSVESARRHEDYARQMADMEASFAQQRAQRQADYVLQMQEVQAQHERDRQQRAAEFAQQQTDAQEEFEYEQKQEQARFDQQMRDLEEYQAYEKRLLDEQTEYEKSEMERRYQWDKHYRQIAFNDQVRMLSADVDARNYWYGVMQRDMDAWLRSMASSVETLLPRWDLDGRQAGGYAGRGVYVLGEAGREFVLNADATRAAEIAAGGRLTQERLLASMVAGSRRGARAGATMVLQQNFRFEGSLSEAERHWYRTTARRQAAAAFMEVLQ